MTNVLILGAGGQVAGHVIRKLVENPSINLTLYLRNASRLEHLASDRVRLVDGDLLDQELLQDVVRGQQIVYVNINGNEDVIADETIKVMQNAGVQRLIFIAAIGIYNEVPGEFGQWNEKMIGPILERYKKAASLIEGSDLEYTILRPTWYTNDDEIAYTISQKGEPVTGTEISRRSVADLIIHLVENPQLHVRESLGMEKPDTAGNKPAFIS